jgi:diacylglycerol kinase (ATP)
VPVSIPRPLPRGCLASESPIPPHPSFTSSAPPRHLSLSRVHLVVNPFSGKKKGLKILERVTPVFTANRIEVVVHRTTHAGHAAELGASIEVRDRDREAIVSIGGDGTFHELVNGVMARGGGDRPAVGVIPGGTGNSLCVDLKLKTPEEAARVICEGQVRWMDLGECVYGADSKRLFFINLVATSIAAESNATAEKMRWMGPLRYDVGAAINIFKFRSHPQTVTVDGHALEGDFPLVAVLNNQHAGSNMRFSPVASLDDGRLDLVLGEKRGGRRRLLNLLGKLGKATHALAPECSIYHFQTLSVESKQGQMPVIVDGECVGETPVRITCRARALEIIF